ncbi:MAG: SHOCT domain-containing protein [Bacteroidia bacterium]|nr:SHOCT domain-containing protein [Bacteroidia bacterium]
MHYYNGHVWGMHYIWWIIWFIVIIWIFATPYDIPGQRRKKDTPIDILKKRFARGEITKEEYEEKKEFLNKN